MLLKFTADVDVATVHVLIMKHLISDVASWCTFKNDDTSVKLLLLKFAADANADVAHSCCCS